MAERLNGILKCEDFPGTAFVVFPPSCFQNRYAGRAGPGNFPAFHPSNLLRPEFHRPAEKVQKVAEADAVAFLESRVSGEAFFISPLTFRGEAWYSDAVP